MEIRRRIRLLASLPILAVLVLAGGLSARADTWPDKPIRIIVPFPAGQGADIISRLIGERLSSALKQPVIIENRAGAGSMLGSAYAAHSDPDGYTLLAAGSSALAINQYLYSKMTFNPQKDFEPIIQLVDIEYLLVVRPGLNVKTAQEFIELARREPGKISYGSSGKGATNQLVMAQFAASTGIKMLHVPYKGSADSMTGLLGGQIDALVESVAVVSPYLNSGQVRILGITKLKRSTLLPEVPTLDEQGIKNFNYSTWTGLVAPKGTNPAILDRLSTEVGKIVGMEDVQKRIRGIGMVPIGGSRDDFRAYVKSESEKWKSVVDLTGTYVE